MGRDAFGYQSAGLDVRGLHVDRADPQLLVAEQTLEMVGHVVFDQIRMAIDSAYQVGLVAADVEVTVADLPIVVGPNGVVPLADMDGDVDVVGQPFYREIDRIHRGADVLIACRRKIGIVDLNMLAPGLRQTAEVVVEQLTQIEHHLAEITVIFVKGNCRQQVRPGHRDLYRFACKGGDCSEFVGQTEIYAVGYRASADRSGVGDIWIVLGDLLGPGFSLKGRNLLPEMVEHSVRGRVTIVGAPMHLAVRDHVDPRRLLLQDRRLHRAKLCVAEIGRLELPQSYEAVERLKPARDAMRPDDSGRVFRIPRHRPFRLYAVAVSAGKCLARFRTLAEVIDDEQVFEH